jgi:hypothetical protein
VEATTSSTNTNTASGDAKSSKLSPTIMTSIPADSPLLKNLSQPLPLGDGKVTLTRSTSNKVAEEIRKKPIPQVQPQPAAVALKQHQVAAQQAEKALKQPTTSTNQSQNQSNVCGECHATNNTSAPSAAAAAKTPEQPHPVTKRAADSASASSTVPSTPSSTTTTSPTGPPLVPSQVRYNNFLFNFLPFIFFPWVACVLFV